MLTLNFHEWPTPKPLYRTPHKDQNNTLMSRTMSFTAIHCECDYVFTKRKLCVYRAGGR